MSVRRDIYYYDVEKEAEKHPVKVRKTADILAYMHEYERKKQGKEEIIRPEEDWDSGT